MLKWIAILLLVALVAGALGFTRLSNVAGKGALILAGLFVAFLVVILLLFAWAGGGFV